MLFITCYIDPDTEILSAGNNAFSGTLPDEISEIPHLREIYFELNWLTGPLPETIGQAKELGQKYIDP
jgi:hypothetical protein